MSKKPIKCKIVQTTYTRAIDEEGNSHSIANLPDSDKTEFTIYSDVEGILTSNWSQDKYDDGTYARSESLHTSFEIVELNTPRAIFD